MAMSYYIDDEDVEYLELPDFTAEWKKHPMRKPYVSSVMLNCAVGRSGQPLEDAKEVLRSITDREPAERLAKRSVREFSIREGEAIAAMVTMRGEEAYKQLKRLLETKDYKLKETCFDEFGNFAFGVKEHINVEGTRYDPNLGIIGFNVVVQMARPGFRVHYRRSRQKKVPKAHKLSREESMKYIQDQFDIKIIPK